MFFVVVVAVDDAAVVCERRDRPEEGAGCRLSLRAPLGRRTRG